MPSSLISKNPLFLIAMPELADPNFARSVVLIFQHTQEGAIGLTLNRTSEVTLGTFARSKGFECKPEYEQIHVLQGGPVEPDHGWILHTDATIEEKQEILPGLFLSGSVGTLRHLLEHGTGDLRLILGYSGWSAGQLEVEMSEGTWVTCPAQPHHVFAEDTSQIWRKVLAEMGINPANLSGGGGGVH
jgi:putative transcriptional regulator